MPCDPGAGLPRDLLPGSALGPSMISQQGSGWPIMAATFARDEARNRMRSRHSSVLQPRGSVISRVGELVAAGAQ